MLGSSRSTQHEVRCSVVDYVESNGVRGEVGLQKFADNERIKLIYRVDKVLSCPAKLVRASLVPLPCVWTSSIISADCIVLYLLATRFSLFRYVIDRSVTVKVCFPCLLCMMDGSLLSTPFPIEPSRVDANHPLRRLPVRFLDPVRRPTLRFRVPAAHLFPF